MIKWEKLEKAQLYSASSGRYNLCVVEILNIMYTMTSLNKKCELFSASLTKRLCLVQNVKLSNVNAYRMPKKRTSDVDTGNDSPLGMSEQQSKQI